MIDNDQTTIIEAPEVYKSIPTHSPTATPTTECTREKNVDFDTFDGHVMVNNIEPNFQEFIFGPIRVGLITQKPFWDHLKNCHSWGRTPYQHGRIPDRMTHPANGSVYPGETCFLVWSCPLSYPPRYY